MTEKADEDDWRFAAEKRLGAVNGLHGTDGRVLFAMDRNSTDRARAIETALARVTKAMGAQGEAINDAGGRLESAIQASDEALKGATADLVGAIKALVDSNNASTQRMSRLQTVLIVLTLVYVALTGIIAFATVRAVWK